MRRNLVFALFGLAVAGCIEVTPHGQTPTPGPGPAPVPDSPLRRAVAEALTDVPRPDCVKLYGVFTALASYVEAGSPGVDSTAQLLQLTTRTLSNLAWAKGQYPRLAEVIRTELNTRFKTPRPMNDARAEVVATFQAIAAGCHDGASRP
jgi:hypothetical protein